MNTRSFAGHNQSLLVAQQQLENGQIEYAAQILNELLAKNPENVDALHLMSMAHYMQGDLEKAINCCKTACELMPNNTTLLNNLGNFLKANQDYVPAKVAYERALLNDRTCFPAQYNLGNVLSALNYSDKAIEAYKKAIKLDSKYADCYYNLGLEYSKSNKHRLAIDAYKEALKQDSNHVLALTQLGSAYCHLNHYNDAVKIFENIVKQKDIEAGTYNNFGVALTHAGQAQRAEGILSKAVSKDPKNLDYLHNLGLAQAACGKIDQSITTFRNIIERDKTVGSAHISLARSYMLTNKLPEAEEVLEEAIRSDSSNFELWIDMATCFSKQQKEAECINALEQAQDLNPHSIIPRWAKTICQLKHFSKDVDEFDKCFSNYENELSELEEIIYNENFKDWSDAASAANFLAAPFTMILQDRNVKDIQARFGKLFQYVMTNAYPQWATPPKTSGIAKGDKIKIGVVSPFFNNHSVYKMITSGWFSNFDRNKFHLTAYSVSDEKDFLRDEIIKSYDKFFESTDFATLCNRIREDEQHILFYPSIGMVPAIYKLASLKLAPIQCSGWGHPITSGISTIDCLFVSDTLEPQDAANHYSEPIIRLPGLGSYYDPNTPEPVIEDLESYGISKDSTKFLCVQTLHKYLPRHDEIFVRIAKEVPNAQFLFSRKSSTLAPKLMKRLSRVFKKHNMNANEFIVFLPALNLGKYLGLCKQADIFLDTPVNSGLLSSIEALETGIVPVTIGGDFMRSNQTSNLLRLLGIEETIASSIDEYIEIAVRLAKDPTKRNELREKIIANKSVFYRDDRVPKALQEHLEKAALIKYGN